MNILSVFTRKTEKPNVYDVYWRTGLVVKGHVVVTISQDMTDGQGVAAELATTRYLLEDRCVCGDNKAGKGLTIRFSLGAIKKLVREESGKGWLSPYANFLRTRFVGAGLEVENRRIDWVDLDCDRNVAEIEVTGPTLTTIHIGGIGEVELSGHALRQYIERFDIKPENAWRKIRNWAPKASRLTDRQGTLRQVIAHRKEAMYALSEDHRILLVVMPPKPGRVLPCLVTVYSME